MSDTYNGNLTGEQFLFHEMRIVAKLYCVDIPTADKLVEKMDYSDHKSGDCIFLTGIEKAFPFMRAHKILDCMQPVFGDVPIVVFYPGEFDGQGLSLFNKLNER